MRCVAHLLERFGIPAQNKVSLDPRQLDRVAKQAVNATYFLGFLIPSNSYRQQRIDAFRQTYTPHLGLDCGAAAYFIGLWDTVAAYGLGRFKPDWYDRHVPKEFGYIRHALSIDENRKDFARVGLGGSRLRAKVGDEPDPLQQVWFAGNHSDIGGSYPENESRLSDISLQWMLNFVSDDLPPAKRILFNPEMLRLFPAHDGMMHDECQSSRIRWQQAHRQIDPHAQLHPTVIQRMQLPSVREYSGYAPYRPEQLRDHAEAGQYFDPSTDPRTTTKS